MGVQRLEHVGIAVEDLEAAVEFFVGLGFEADGEAVVEGEWVGRVIGLEDVRSKLAFVKAPDGGTLELFQFLSPPMVDGKADAPANALGIRHLAFAVDDIDATVAGLRERGGELVGEVVQYENSWRTCYARGPEGIIVELAEKLG